MKRIILLKIGILLAVAVCTNATVLTFDDIGTGSGGKISDGYGGLNWSKSFYDGTFYFASLKASPINSGLLNSAVSGDFVAWPTPYMPEGKGWLTSTAPFTFTGAYFTAVWRDGLNIKLDGYLNNVLTHSTTVTINTTGPTWCEFDYANIDELQFSASGGTQHQGYQHDSTQFVMDNFTFTPEPASLVLLGLGALLIRKHK